MESLASKVGAGTLQAPSTTHATTRLKHYGFALLMILAVGSIIAGVYFLSGPIPAYPVPYVRNFFILTGSLLLVFSAAAIVLKLAKSNQTLPEINSGATYGAEVLSYWNVKAFGKIQPQPKINWDEEDPFFPGKTLRETSFLVYKPETLLLNGRQVPFSINALEEMLLLSSNETRPQFEFYSSEVKKRFGDTPISGGWMLMTKDLVPAGEGSSLKEKGYRHPKAAEVCLGIFLHQAQTGELLLSETPARYAACQETYNDNQPLVVGANGPDGLTVRFDFTNLPKLSTLAIREIKV